MPCPGNPDPKAICFPVAPDEFVAKAAQDIISEDHVNLLQDAIVRLEEVLGVGIVGFDPSTDTVLTTVRDLLQGLRDDVDELQPPPGEPPQVSVRGLEVEDVTTTRVQIGIYDVEVHRGDETLQEWNEVTVSADLAGTGAGGRQSNQGALGPDQWWSLHLLVDSTGARPPSACFVRATAPEQAILFPTGYDAQIRVSCVRTNGSSQVLQFMQVENRVYYKDAQSAWGATVATGAWTKVYLGNLVSPYSREAMLMLRITRGGGSGIANMNVRYPGSFGDRGLLAVQTADNGGDTDFSSGIVPVDKDRHVEYRMGGSASPIDGEGMVVGYVDRFLAAELL